MNNTGHAIALSGVMLVILFCEWQDITIRWFAWIPLVIVFGMALGTWLTTEDKWTKKDFELKQEVGSTEVHKNRQETEMLRRKLRWGEDRSLREKSIDELTCKYMRKQMKLIDLEAELLERKLKEEEEHEHSNDGGQASDDNNGDGRDEAGN